MKKRTLLRGRSAKHGLPPGTPVYVGKAPPGPVRITVIDYDEGRLVEREVERPEECFAFRDRPTVTWINVDGIHDAALIQSLGEHFGLHPLVQEDIVNTEQRPKAEDFGEYLYLVVKMLRWNDAAGEMDVEQVSLVLGRGFVLSFQERAGDVFDPVRDRIRAGKGRVRTMGADYLAYSLLDAVVDGYFAVLEKRGEQVEALEDEVIARPSPPTLAEIYRLRREGLVLRRCVWPLRELVASLERSGSPLLGEGIGAYLRDAYDHAVQVIDAMETLREMLSGMLETYLSSLSNRMNEVMKVLTIIATIFIPLTFIAGVYGMNLHMPETKWWWAYPAVLGVMLLVAAAMVVYFRRKRWL